MEMRQLNRFSSEHHHFRGLNGSSVADSQDANETRFAFERRFNDVSNVRVYRLLITGTHSLLCSTILIAAFGQMLWHTVLRIFAN